ncbi:hypothetical protein NHX12_010622 [Muraenolepis orangiensis]|uniref:Spermatogenesis associated 22 n=1 Tax=Muraenolepis orangiensis TaxID=630683 RepID=A0A9Q0I946_9TELE|nr:hypothetical protein NHX12_010622 [Muraenolepis orangiensis]
MKRHEDQQQARPTAGCLSVPLFNQKKRTRIPVTSNPSEKDFCVSNEYMLPTRQASSSNRADTKPSLEIQTHQQQQHSFTESPGYSPRGNEPECTWHSEGLRTPPAFQIQKPSTGQSLRILTAVIAGMRHWSQFKDRAAYLFEIFATLDSAVTMGSHGSKSFLMRDGKETVQCVFYENEKELPRLIRGQVHRCVGNYDQAKDLLTCVSVRPGLPSEQRNAQETVKACNVEMRALVKSFSEV